MEIQKKGGKMAEIQIRGKRPIILGTCEDKEKKGEHSVGMPHGGKHRWNTGHYVYSYIKQVRTHSTDNCLNKMLQIEVMTWC